MSDYHDGNWEMEWATGPATPYILHAEIEIIGNRRYLRFTNPLPKEQRCKSTTVVLSAKVYSQGPAKVYTTTFSLNPQSCTTPTHVNFQKDCSGMEDLEPTTETPNQDGTNPFSRV